MKASLTMQMTKTGHNVDAIKNRNIREKATSKHTGLDIPPEKHKARNKIKKI